MKVLGSLIFVAFILILPQNLLAHRVNLFALVEGQVIQGKSKFSNAKPAKQAKILVYNLVTKELLLDLKTNDEGEFSFQVPEIAPSSGLLLKVDAGEGHQNTYTLEVEEFANIASTSKDTLSNLKENTPKDNTLKDNSLKENSASKEAHQAESFALKSQNLDELRLIVREELHRELNPLRKSLKEALQPEPGFREILGGVGWLIGLGALLALVWQKPKG